MLLFLLYILEAVKGNSRKNNDTFKDELKVCINSQDGQRVGQCGEDGHTYHYT